ncbi:hypothetical protein [Pleionea sediminis]|uniref:hypothetical protein n=1 Tax=Pleionea sediminis TaxID=2569479 RepID=UPI0011867C22|nr:hypothetical protein [Pleionea sediminis]
MFYKKEYISNNKVKVSFSSLVKWVALFLLLMISFSVYAGFNILALFFFISFVSWMGLFLHVTKEVRQDINVQLSKGDVEKTGSDWSFSNPSAYTYIDESKNVELR